MNHDTIKTADWDVMLTAYGVGTVWEVVLESTTGLEPLYAVYVSSGPVRRPAAKSLPWPAACDHVRDGITTEIEADAAG